jgi:4-alpha-glucanotransferase
VRVDLTLESGEERSWETGLGRRPVLKAATIEGAGYVVKSMEFAGPLPPGRHRLVLTLGGSAHEATVISAPRKVYTRAGEKAWGVFAPLYALHSQRGGGEESFSDLETLHRAISPYGGSAVATLPLLASFLDEPFEPSPYSPASRLFWNEFFVDPRRVPELARCPEAQRLLGRGAAGGLGKPGRSPLVDYRVQMALKRKALEALSRCFWDRRAERPSAYFDFIRSRPDAEDYARFRAAAERRRRPWPEWPERLRNGTLKPGDYDTGAMQYHLYAQWTAHGQLGSLAAKGEAGGLCLYLDLPLGIHAGSYDAWRHRELFLGRVCGGAPPDAVFVHGQNWGFPPLHPDRLREDGYRYMERFLGHNMRHAGMLRIDHVMGLHRIYCIPDGMDADQGAFVRYPFEELYAALSLESHRHRCGVVGENLGTVPAEVNKAVERHGVGKMYVVQYELESDRRAALPPVPENSVASLNTHDMFPFAAYWEGKDIAAREEMGLLSRDGALRETARRRRIKHKLVRVLAKRGLLKGGGGVRSVLRACIAYLSASPAFGVMINIEDLWLETEPQNIPGTSANRPNWRRRLRYGIEEFTARPDIVRILKEINRGRNEAGTKDVKGQLFRRKGVYRLMP